MSGTLVHGQPERIVEVKAAGDGWEVAGYASTWNRDLGDDVVHPGAFKASIDSGARVRFLWAHKADQVLGRPIELREDDTGLFGRFRISKTPLGQDVYTHLKDGNLDSFSIGFIPRDFEHDQKAGVRHLKAVDLLEVSVVAMPMQPAALVTSVKATDYATLTLEQLLDTYDTHRAAVLTHANAVVERRLAEGRKLTDASLATLDRLRRLAEADAAELLRLATSPPTPKTDAPAPVQTAGVGPMVEAHLRRAQLNARRRAYEMEPLKWPEP